MFSGLVKTDAASEKICAAADVIYETEVQIAAAEDKGSRVDMEGTA